MVKIQGTAVTDVPTKGMKTEIILKIVLGQVATRIDKVAEREKIEVSNIYTSLS